VTSDTSHLMVMAGGTGGHVFPALAVAKEMQAAGTRITWLGTRRGIEARVIPENGISMEWVTIEGLRGNGLVGWLLAPFKLLRALWQSANAIRRTQPDCVLGMGGFVAGPGGVAARILSKPLVVHEQNAVAGLTNKYLAKIASSVLTGFPDVLGLKQGAKWVGNPVRKSICPNISETSGINILIIGGSQGAHSLNEKLPSIFAELGLGEDDMGNDSLDTDRLKQIKVWHQTGRNRSEKVIAAYDSKNIPAKVSEFIDDMTEAYQWADLLICRAGAMTIAECCAAGLPSLLVPYPFSAGDHQLKNAQALVDIGAAKLVSNQQLGEPIMLETLGALLADKDALMSMGGRAHTLHKADALQQVVNVCQDLMHSDGSHA